MDNLIAEFLEETLESLEKLEGDFVRLEQSPGDAEIVNNIFRVMHTIKGTCGFLGLSRLEGVAHAAENIMDKVRDEVFSATPAVISLVLEANDRINMLVRHLEEHEVEPEGDDSELIDRLNACAESGGGVAAVLSADASGFSPSEEAMSVDRSVDSVPAGSGTPDLDEEIDFTPVAADYVADGGRASATTASRTPDLDEEIDFTPVAADYVAGGVSKVVAKTQSTTSSSGNHKSKAIEAGLKIAKEAEEGGALSGKTGGAQQSIRVGIDTLENLMSLVGELVLTRNQLLQILRKQGSAANEFSGALQRLNHITSELQEGVMQTRMQPIGNAWAKFPRLVRDLAHELGKKIDLRMIGAETELDRQMLDAIKDPLTHMVRNAADHGLELPEQRRASGKSETGVVTLNAYHEGGHIIITIADDGKGLDVERIKKKALENGLAGEAELVAMSDKQAFQYIFKPGFSTAEKVTAISGRGVGMDVVSSSIGAAGGHVEVQSQTGKGSTFIIKLPLTLAIMPVLIVQSAGERFAIPQIRVSEIVRTHVEAPESVEEGADSIKRVEGYVIEAIHDAKVLRLRERLLPLISLADTLRLKRKEKVFTDDTYVVVCEVGSQSYGLLVDRVFHTEEIVVKPASPLLKGINLYAGSTILGDGRVIMIIDPNGMMTSGGTSMIVEDTAAATAEERLADDEVTSFLTFKAWSRSPKAIPLDLVSRLEEVDASKVEFSGGHRVVQYRGGLMRLVLPNDASLEGGFPSAGVMDVIVFTDKQCTLGLVVESILDIVRQPMDLKSVSGEDGILGSQVITEQTTDIIDISYYFSRAFPRWLGARDSDPEFGTGQGRKRRVMLVDDSEFFRKFITPVIRAAGYEVTALSNAQDAIVTLQQDPKQFSAVITDIDMPEMNGIEFTLHCRQMDGVERLPFIALTSHRMEDLGQDIRDAGFNGFVSKAERDQLVQVIGEVIAQGHSSHIEA